MRKKHSKKYHKTDTQLPFIEVQPNINGEASPLPQIVFDCHDKDIAKTAEDKLKERLNFANPQDLLNLHCIRIVNPTAIKLPSKEITMGLYNPSHGNRKAEILLSVELFKPTEKIISIVERLSWKDRLFEALYHEIGHHKATTSHGISKYKGEAYAERYMYAYKKVWIKNHPVARIFRKIIAYVIRMILSLIIIIAYIFFRKDPVIRLYYQRVTGKISSQEYNRKFNELYKEEDGDEKKKKWVHPLRKEKYCRRFHVKDR